MAFVDITKTEEDRPEVDNVVWYIPWEHDALLFSGESIIPWYCLSYNKIKSTSVFGSCKKLYYHNNRQVQTFRLIILSRQKSQIKRRVILLLILLLLCNSDSALDTTLIFSFFWQRKTSHHVRHHYGSSPERAEPYCFVYLLLLFCRS